MATGQLPIVEQVLTNPGLISELSTFVSLTNLRLVNEAVHDAVKIAGAFCLDAGTSRKLLKDPGALERFSSSGEVFGVKIKRIYITGADLVSHQLFLKKLDSLDIQFHLSIDSTISHDIMQAIKRIRHKVIGITVFRTFTARGSRRYIWAS